MSSVTHSSAIFLASGSSIQSKGKIQQIDLCSTRTLHENMSVTRSFVPQRIVRPHLGRNIEPAFPSHKHRSHRVTMMARKSASDGDPTSKAILDAFLIGRALADTINERLASALGEALSEVSKRQAEQNEQIRQFQEEVKERAASALVKAIKESNESSGPKTSSTYGSRPRATTEYTAAQPSPYDKPPETPKKRVTIVPAEGLDIDYNS